jgi:hypothetical protein
MSQESQQAIMHVLQQDSPVLDVLMGRLKYLYELQIILTAYLDTKLANRCLVANFENGCLTVITESALWATQFRFQAPTLLEKLKLHPEFVILKKIICKIRPAPNKRALPVAPEVPPMPRLSQQTADRIILAAATIKDEKLQAIMQKIAQNIKHSFQGDNH